MIFIVHVNDFDNSIYTHIILYIFSNLLRSQWNAELKSYRRNALIYDSDSESEDSDGDSVGDIDDVEDFIDPDEEDSEGVCIHPDKAVALYCNGGRSNIPSMARHKRFYFNLMDKNVSMIDVPECGCGEDVFIMVEDKGIFSTLRTKKDTTLPTNVMGTLKFLSVSGHSQISATPMGIACPVHNSLMYWVYSKDRKLYLCSDLLRKVWI